MARLSGSLAQLAFCQPRCVSPTYAPGASRLLLGLLVAGQLLFLAKQANFGHLLSTGPLMMMVLRYYSHGVRGTQQGPHLLSFTPPAPSAPLRRLRRRSGAFGADFFLFFPLFFSFFGLCQHEKSAVFSREWRQPRPPNRSTAPTRCSRDWRYANLHATRRITTILHCNLIHLALQLACCTTACTSPLRCSRRACGTSRLLNVRVGSPRGRRPPARAGTAPSDAGQLYEAQADLD